MPVISSILDWWYRMVNKFMSKQEPRETTPEETEEVMKKKEEYEEWARKDKV